MNIVEYLAAKEAVPQGLRTKPEKKRQQTLDNTVIRWTQRRLKKNAKTLLHVCLICRL